MKKNIQTGIVHGTKNLFWAAAQANNGKLKFGYCRGNKKHAIERALDAVNRTK